MIIEKILSLAKAANLSIRLYEGGIVLEGICTHKRIPFDSKMTDDDLSLLLEDMRIEFQEGKKTLEVHIQKIKNKENFSRTQIYELAKMPPPYMTYTFARGLTQEKDSFIFTQTG